MANFTGSANAELALGTVNDDTFAMLAGNDTILGSAGNDAINGGADVDTVDYSLSGASVAVNLSSGTGTGGDAQGDTYTSIEAVIGSDYNDSFIAAYSSSTFEGGDGDDTFFSDGLPDSLAGGDIYLGGLGIDTVDYINAGGGVLVDLDIGDGTGAGGEADEDVYVSIENAKGTAFGDMILGSAADNHLIGRGGDDLLAGEDGADTLDGGDGTDDHALYTLSTQGVTVNLATGVASGGEAEGDVLIGIEGIEGSEEADSLTGDNGNNYLEGNSGNDTLIGGGGDDTIYADGGDDLVDGGAGNDQLSGGGGTNTVDYSASASGVTVVLDVMGSATGGMGTDTLYYFQNVIGSASADSITGDSDANVIIGGLGADTMDGGLGIDTLDYSGSAAKVVVNLGTGNGIYGGAQGDVISNFENVIGSGFNDTLTGTTGANDIDGGAGDDTLSGGDGADTLDGGSGNDQLTGGNGNDVYYVDSSDDKITESSTGGTDDRVYATASYVMTGNIERLTLLGSDDLSVTGNSSANILVGNAGHNLMDGGSLNDSISGHEGNDTLIGGLGDDTLVGGDDDDLYYVGQANDVLVELADGGNDTVSTGIAWTLGSNFENLTQTGNTRVAGTGNTLDNVILGNTGSNLLSGMDGNDSIIGDNTSDTLLGGADTLDGGAGDNTLVGGRGDDTYVITTGNDTLVELDGEGTDTVRSDVTHTLATHFENLVLTGTANTNGQGNGANNVLTGNTGDNLLEGGAGDDQLTAGAGNDTLDGGDGADTMTGGLGDDLFVVNNGGDSVVEGSSGGNDTIQTSVSFTVANGVETMLATGTDGITLTGNLSVNTITGNSGANLIYGGGSDDTLSGGQGNDTLVGGSGADSMTGGAGNDVFVVADLTDITLEDLGAGTDTVESSLTWTLAANIENLVLTGTSGLSGTGTNFVNTITGNSGANLLQGLAGADTLIGGEGNDTLNGGIGIDSMDGGAGDDTYYISVLNDVIVEAADGGTDTLRVEFSFVLGDNLENLILVGTTDIDGTGNAVANVLTGSGGANTLYGLGGNDAIFGGNGADTIDGGIGDDTMTGGAGVDTYYVDSTGDVVVEGSNIASDLVIAKVSYALSANVERLTLVSGALDGTGNGIANTIIGNSDANYLSGMAGNDTINGGGGADTLNGGLGNDSLSGGFGDDLYIVNSLTDIVVEAAGSGIDSVESSVTWTLGTNVENLTLTGINAINATGNDVANRLIGNGAANRITGGLGNDVLTGDLGADKFIFNSTLEGADTITEFNGLVSGVAEGDKIQFAAALQTGTFSYIGTALFSAGGSTEIRANLALGRIAVDFNGDGTGDFVVALTGLTSAGQLTASDFIFA